MEQTTEGRTLPENNKKRARIKYTDVVAVVLIAAAIVGLTMLLLSKLSLRRDVNNAQKITDKVIASVSKKDGASARALGSTEFKKLYTDGALTKQFQAIKEATVGTPTVDNQTLFTKNSKKTVYVIYKYPPRLAKRSFFVRIGATEHNHQWQVTSIAGSADESQLFIQ